MLSHWDSWLYQMLSLALIRVVVEPDRENKQGIFLSHRKFYQLVVGLDLKNNCRKIVQLLVFTS